MNHHYRIMQQQTNDRRQQLEREADAYRLANAEKSTDPTHLRRVVSAVGHMLIATGSRLKLPEERTTREPSLAK
jgi:hypothetical protein